MARLAPDAPMPSWATVGSFFSICRTAEELSILCEDRLVPLDVKVERAWRLLKVEGPIDFGLTGVLASVLQPLAKDGISIFAVSTFDTDYLLIKSTRFDDAMASLARYGHSIKP